MWSASLLLLNPEAIYQVHLGYYLSGADVCISSSYQASYTGFAEKGLTHLESDEMFRLSVELTKRARDNAWETIVATGDTPRPFPLVAASIGSFGLI